MGVPEAREHLSLPNTCGHCQSGAPLNENIHEDYPEHSGSMTIHIHSGGRATADREPPALPTLRLSRAVSALPLRQDRLFWEPAFMRHILDLTLSTCGPGLATCPSLAKALPPRVPGIRDGPQPATLKPATLWLTFLSTLISL